MGFLAIKCIHKDDLQTQKKHDRQNNVFKHLMVLSTHTCHRIHILKNEKP